MSDEDRAEQIAEIEKEVATVPASDFEKNIRLYQELRELDPNNKRYESKISYYEQKRREVGFHCLGTWDGSHSLFMAAVKRSMREPDSFEHIETRITPINEDGEHFLVMKYRARNGFGGMTVGTASAVVRNSDCGIGSVVSVE